jgi:nicotinate-nucleotide adenylyltransferase
LSLTSGLDLSTQENLCLKIGNDFPFMPLSNSNEQHQTIKDSVTFFGGSFNPFHHGHMACLDLCPEKNIVIVPDRNPQKEYREFFPYDEYISLTTKLEGTNYLIYPAFWGSREVNPTCTWFPFVKIREKNLLMGDDSFINFLSWKNPEIILENLTKLYVVPRNFSIDDCLKQKEKLLAINSNVQIILLDDHAFRDLSSTKLR